MQRQCRWAAYFMCRLLFFGHSRRELEAFLETRIYRCLAEGCDWGDMRKVRRNSGSFWTPEQDEKLRRLEGEGLSAAKIADELETTRGAVIGRLHRLSRVELTYPSYIRRRARAAARRKERKRVESAAIAKMRQEIARGVSRNRVIARARKSGATLRAIGEALGISLQWVRQIAERR
jgi:hypothetical protein